jgi:AraC-like DNA-binding protein
MNSLQRPEESGWPEDHGKRVDATAASLSRKRASIVWVRHSSAQRAVDLVLRLRAHDFDAELWNESHASESGLSAGDIVVSDSAGLRTIARCVSGLSASSDAYQPRPCRGGLAPCVSRRVLAHIEGKLAQRIETADLAAIAGLSECHFTRAFRQSHGMPPHRYLMSRRIAVGAGLIERTDQALADIALSVGFSDHSHFTRMFVRMTGETPRSYRRRKR